MVISCYWLLIFELFFTECKFRSNILNFVAVELYNFVVSIIIDLRHILNNLINEESVCNK